MDINLSGKQLINNSNDVYKWSIIDIDTNEYMVNMNILLISELEGIDQLETII